MDDEKHGTARPKRWRWLTNSAKPQPEAQVSVWSVRARDARTFFRVAGALWLAALARIVYNAAEERRSGPHGWEGAADLAVAALETFGGVAPGAAVAAMLATRPINFAGGILMTVYQAIVNRFVLPVIEEHKAEGRKQGRKQGRKEGRKQGRVEGRKQGRVEGRKEGRVEGRAEGRTEERQEWLAWNERRMEAERRGAPFDEPPPGWTS